MDVFYPCITGSTTYAVFVMQSLSIAEWTAIQSFSTAEATPTWQVRINKYSLITSLDIPLLMNGWLT